MLADKAFGWQAGPREGSWSGGGAGVPGWGRSPTSTGLLGRKVHVVVLVVHCRFLGRHDRIHMPPAGQRDEDVAAFMDQQLAVDAPVALPREPPYPLAALAAVRPLRATRSVSRAGAVPGHGHPHRSAHRVTWSWARGGPVTLPPQAPRAPIPGDPQRTTVRVTAALAGRAQERQPWVPPGGRCSG